jgi:hypothetical protein
LKWFSVFTLLGVSVARADDLAQMPVGLELVEQRAGEIRIRDGAAASGVADQRPPARR